jgi:hypothetical protein
LEDKKAFLENLREFIQKESEKNEKTTFLGDIYNRFALKIVED